MSSTRVIFRKQNTVTAEATSEQETTGVSQLKQHVIAALRNIYDPELPVNIYELGLIYNIDINDHSEVFVRMTLTAPGCPVAGSLPAEVECTIKAVEGVNDAHVELVWDPPWNQDNMSDEAKLTLGLF